MFEESVLGLCLKNPKYLNLLSDELFQSEENKQLLGVMRDIYREGSGAIHLKVLENRYGSIPTEILMVSDYEADTAFLSLYKELYEKYAREDIIRRADELRNLAKSNEPLDFAQVHKILYKNYSYDTSSASMPMAVADYMDVIRQQRNGTYKYTSTGYPVLDKAIGGEFKPKTMVLIYGDSGAGKTAFVLDSMNHLDKLDIKTAFISIEMPKDTLISRLIAVSIGINLNLLNDASRLSEDDLERVEAELNRIKDSNLRIIDDIRYIEDIVLAIRSQVDEGVRVVYIDYLQLIETKDKNHKDDPYGYAARVLSRLAKQLGITIVILSQVTQGLEDLDRCRFSKSPPKDADIVFEIMPDGDTSDPKYTYGMLLIYKNRFGKAKKKIPYTLEGSRQRYYIGVEADEY